MVTKHVRAVSLAVIVALAAGCVEVVEGTEPPRATDPNDPNFQSDDPLFVSGLVMSDELFPVVGANVSLDPTLSTTTDDAGAFLIANIPQPATYTLTVNTTGYEPFEQQLDVTAPIEGLNVALKGIPGQSPYAATYLRTGFDACSISLVYSAGPVNPPGGCPFGARDTVMKVEVNDTWAAGVFELDWESSETMIFATSVGTEDTTHGRRLASCSVGTWGHDWCPALLFGHAPLKILARPNDTEYAAQFAIDGKETFPGGENFTSWIFSSYSGYGREELNQTFYNQCGAVNQQFNIPRTWGCPFGVGYSLGIRITYYHTIFYLQAPERLEEFSAMPDA